MFTGQKQALLMENTSKVNFAIMRIFDSMEVKVGGSALCDITVGWLAELRSHFNNDNGAFAQSLTDINYA